MENEKKHLEKKHLDKYKFCGGKRGRRESLVELFLTSQDLLSSQENFDLISKTATSYTTQF